MRARQFKTSTSRWWCSRRGAAPQTGVPTMTSLSQDKTGPKTIAGTKKKKKGLVTDADESKRVIKTTPKAKAGGKLAAERQRKETKTKVDSRQPSQPAPGQTAPRQSTSKRARGKGSTAPQGGRGRPRSKAETESLALPSAPVDLNPTVETAAARQPLAKRSKPTPPAAQGGQPPAVQRKTPPKIKPKPQSTKPKQKPDASLASGVPLVPVEQNPTVDAAAEGQPSAKRSKTNPPAAQDGQPPAVLRKTPPKIKPKPPSTKPEQFKADALDNSFVTPTRVKYVPGNYCRPRSDVLTQLLKHEAGLSRTELYSLTNCHTPDRQTEIEAAVEQLMKARDVVELRGGQLRIPYAWHERVKGMTTPAELTCPCGTINSSPIRGDFRPCRRGCGYNLVTTKRLGVLLYVRGTSDAHHCAGPDFSDSLLNCTADGSPV